MNLKAFSSEVDEYYYSEIDDYGDYDGDYYYEEYEEIDGLKSFPS